MSGPQFHGDFHISGGSLSFGPDADIVQNNNYFGSDGTMAEVRALLAAVRDRLDELPEQADADEALEGIEIELRSARPDRSKVEGLFQTLARIADASAVAGLVARAASLLFQIWP
jgi:hypothetical protein